MTNNRLRFLIISISVGLIVLFVIGAIIYLLRHSDTKVVTDAACHLPKSFLKDYDFDYTKNPNEYRNTNSSVDYFRLSLSWSPTFCSKKLTANNSFQCQHDFGLIVHGLWPSTFKKVGTLNSTQLYPRNCRNEGPISIDLIRKYFCIMPSETLMQGEWEKHGTCYWQKPEEYFEQIKLLYSKLHIPQNIKEILSDTTITSKRYAIKKKFISLNPELVSEFMDVVMIRKGKVLNEIQFCYDLTFNYIECKHDM